MSESRTPALHKIAAAVKEHQRFLVATHIRPDGDALGSVLAMTFMLRKLGKAADAYCQDAAPPSQEFLPGVTDILHGDVDVSRYQVAVLVDCGDLHRVGAALEAKLPHFPLLVNIDHHVSSTPFGNVYWVDPTASSTCEMLYDLSCVLPLELDEAIASQLYTGVLMDTGSFRFGNTTKKSLEVAAALVGAGARPAYIARQVYDSNSPNRLRLLAEVLGTLSFFADNRLATAVITQEMYARTQTTPVDSEAFINQLRSVKAVQIAIVFRAEANGTVYASLRSKGEVDVAAFAQKYGGGGHRQAAALRVTGDFETLCARITQDVLSYMG
jgi:bifunctional oligoribonuclease and PAP phosphatase NrnA